MKSDDSDDDLDTWSIEARASQSSILQSDKELIEQTFSRFTSLPRELRLQIWELFCPELKTPLTLEMSIKPMRDDAYCLTVYSTPNVSHSTRDTRTVLAVHSESRILATQALPDTLSFRASQNSSIEGLIHFNQARDLVFLTQFVSSPRAHGNTAPVSYSLPNFAAYIQNVAITSHYSYPLSFFETLIGLKKIFFCRRASSMATSRSKSTAMTWKWFTSSSCYQRHSCVGTEMAIYCWPKLQDGIPHLPKRMAAYPLNLSWAAKEHGWQMLPMVVFKGESGITLYEQLENIELEYGPQPGSPAEESSDSYYSYSSFSSYSSPISVSSSSGIVVASPPSPDIVTLLSALQVNMARQVDEQRAERRAERKRVNLRRAQRRAAWKRRWRVELEYNLSARLSRFFQGEAGDLNDVATGQVRVTCRSTWRGRPYKLVLELAYTGGRVRYLIASIVTV